MTAKCVKLLWKEQVSCAEPAFQKPMLTGSDHLSALYISYDGAQDDLLIDRPAIAWILIPASLYIGITFIILQPTETSQDSCVCL